MPDNTPNPVAVHPDGSAAEPARQSPQDRLKEITTGIEQGIKDLFNSDRYASYLRTMSHFHHYSVNNTMLIYMQKPDATLVAGFNMVSGLLIMLLRNVPTIGTLKTLGMGNGAIGGLFVRIGARAVLRGMLIGNALALLFCFVQGKWHLIPLDPANYFVSYVPVHVNLPWILAADASAFLGILALLWLPSLVISTIDPARNVKAD